MAQNLPIGSIILWKTGTIPDGWQLCDGTNGTPNMIGKFARGASVDGDLGATGGGSTHTHTNPNTSTRANHNHGGSTTKTSGSGGAYGARTGTGWHASNDSHTHGGTYSVSAEDSHSHTMSDTGSSDNMPTYITRQFIMRIS